MTTQTLHGLSSQTRTTSNVARITHPLRGRARQDAIASGLRAIQQLSGKLGYARSAN